MKELTLRETLEEAMKIELPIDADGNSLVVGDEVACFAILGAGERSEIRCIGSIVSMSLCDGNEWLLQITNGMDNEDGDICTEYWPPANVALVEVEGWNRLTFK